MLRTVKNEMELSMEVCHRIWWIKLFILNCFLRLKIVARKTLSNFKKMFSFQPEHFSAFELKFLVHRNLPLKSFN